MNPLCTLIELGGWRDVYETSKRVSLSADMQPALRSRQPVSEVLNWIESKEYQIYTALARRFLHPASVESPNTELMEVSDEFVQVIRNFVVGPLGKICKTVPDRTGALLGNGGKLGPTGAHKIFPPAAGGEEGPTVVGRVGARGGKKFYSSVAWWEWTDLFLSKEVNVGKGCGSRRVRGETPSFEQWNASSLAAIRGVGDVVSEVQKDLMLALNRLAEGRFGRVIDEAGGKRCDSLWLELVFMLEDAFEAVVTNAVELILWSVHQYLVGDGVFAAHPLFSLKAFWQYSNRTAALSPTPAEVHERLMNRVKKELIWNVVPEFNLNQMVKRQATGSARTRRSSLRNRLMEEGQIKRMWDAIHFAASQRCDELQDSLRTLTEAYAFYFSNENEFPQMSCERLREIRGGLRSLLVDTSQRVGQGAFVVYWDSLHQIAVDKLEVAFQKVEEENKCADALRKETVTAARLKELGKGEESSSSSHTLGSLLDTFRRRRKVQGKYDRGLDPLAHITRLIGEQKESESCVRSELTILWKNGPAVADFDVAGIVNRTSGDVFGSHVLLEANVTSAKSVSKVNEKLPSPEYAPPCKDAHALRPSVACSGVNNMGCAEVKGGPLACSSGSARSTGQQQHPGDSVAVARSGRDANVTREQRAVSDSQRNSDVQQIYVQPGSTTKDKVDAPSAADLLNRGEACTNSRQTPPIAHSPQPSLPSTDQTSRPSPGTNAEVPGPISECFPLFAKTCPRAVHPIPQADPGVNTYAAPQVPDPKQNGVIAAEEVPQAGIHYAGSTDESGDIPKVEEPSLAAEKAVVSAPQEGGEVAAAAAGTPPGDEDRQLRYQKLELLHFSISSIEAARDRVKNVKKLLPFLPDMLYKGVFIEDINLSDSRLETSMNRLRAVRGSATVLRNYREVAVVEDSVSTVIESLAEELAAATLRMLSRFPFLEGRVCGVLLGNLQVLDVDDEFQSLIGLYRSSQKEKGPTESIEHCLRARAQILARNCPYVVTPDRYEGHTITLEEDVVVGAPVEDTHQANCRQSGHQVICAQATVNRHVGCTAATSAEEVPEPSQPCPPGEKSVDAASSLRFVRNVHVREQPPLRDDPDFSGNIAIDEKGCKASSTATAVVQTRTVLSPGNPPICVGRPSSNSLQQGAKANTSTEVDAAFRRSSAKPSGTNALEGCPRYNRGLRGTESPAASAQSSGSIGYNNPGTTSMRRETPPSVATPSTNQQETDNPAVISRASGSLHEKEGCRNNGRSGSARTNFFDTIEKGLMDERAHLQELETILRQVVKGCDSAPAESKPKSPGLRATTSLNALPGVSSVACSAECGSQSSNASSMAERTATSSVTKWASPSSALLSKARVASSSAATGRSARKDPTASPRPSVDVGGSGTSYPHHANTVARGEKEPETRTAGRKGGNEATWSSTRQKTDGSGGDYGKRKHHSRTLGTGGDTNLTCLSDPKYVQLPSKKKLLTDGDASPFKSITDAVVKSSWGTVDNELDSDLESKRLPSVPSTAQRGKLNELFRRPQAPQNGRMPWGRFTISHSSPSGVSLPNPFSSSYSADACRVGHGNPSPFPHLSPTAKPDSPTCRTHGRETDCPLSNSAGLRQQYIASCRRACVKPNSMLTRLLPDKPGVFISRIDTSVNYIGPKGFLPVMHVLQLNGGLEYLNLSHNNLENDEVVELVQVLLNDCGASLSFLDLSNNPISLVGGAALLRLVQMRPLLSTVQVKGTLIPQQVCRSIQEACENNAAADSVDEITGGFCFPAYYFMTSSPVVVPARPATATAMYAPPPLLRARCQSSAGTWHRLPASCTYGHPRPTGSSDGGVYYRGGGGTQAGRVVMRRHSAETMNCYLEWCRDRGDMAHLQVDNQLRSPAAPQLPRETTFSMKSFTPCEEGEVHRPESAPTPRSSFSLARRLPGRHGVCRQCVVDVVRRLRSSAVAGGDGVGVELKRPPSVRQLCHSSTRPYSCCGAALKALEVANCPPLRFTEEVPRQMSVSDDAHDVGCRLVIAEGTAARGVTREACVVSDGTNDLQAVDAHCGVAACAEVPGGSADACAGNGSEGRELPTGRCCAPSTSPEERMDEAGAVDVDDQSAASSVDHAENRHADLAEPYPYSAIENELLADQKTLKSIAAVLEETLLAIRNCSFSNGDDDGDDDEKCTE